MEEKLFDQILYQISSFNVFIIKNCYFGCNL